VKGVAKHSPEDEGLVAASRRYRQQAGHITLNLNTVL